MASPTQSMGMSLGKLLELVMDREALFAVVHGKELTLSSWAKEKTRLTGREISILESGGEKNTRKTSPKGRQMQGTRKHRDRSCIQG